MVYPFLLCTACPTGYVACATFSNSGPPCVNNSLVCNSFSDCADQSDEFYCNGKYVPYIRFIIRG